ncbi:MAG: RagB/SusD family nutrient uptake outer membrane protein [Candidatus Pseudobacter hemicellulosilyticus]|uniref:RagB/SusD family nutrient uptake outer membrane protein n=1 Tax=Candidatus Pseudobacter hemicellulosilyticus TaxID=3121375 RepID=A0AAJ6BG36_9BACT|nr:MAG: RagB/SusD family nutrient uptake outer membrane protein [Pseudobacter sp.]
MNRLICLYSFLAALSLTGCTKFLDKNPDNRTELNSVEKVSQLLATAYPNAGYMAFAEAASDNAGDKGTGDRNLMATGPYRFDDVVENNRDFTEYYWINAYAAIAAANQALKACAEATNPEAYTSQRGEGLVARAYAHFMLVTFFSKVYDPATAGSDAGIPYVTEPETEVFSNYERRTVQYVYEMIEKDLLEGLPLLDDTRYTIPKYHFTKASANAFAARFFLFKQDYQAAANHASRVFPDNNFANNMRPWLTAYKNYTADEQFLNYTKATDPANLLLTEAASVWARNFAQSRYGLTQQLNAKILGANVTGNNSWAYRQYNYGQDHPAILKWKEYFYRTSVNANIGFPYVMVPLFTTEEALLNRAECFARLGKTDSCLADLNTFASQRFNSYNSRTHAVTVDKATAFYAGTDATQALINTTLDFKRAEFVQEGMRWFDVIRNKINIVHVYIDPDDPTVRTTIEVPHGDPRRVFQIPESAKQSGIELNPR